MSKKRKNQLIKGKFYTSYPNGGHPALIYNKNKKKNMYDAIVFGTTKGHHAILMCVPIANNISQSVVHTRPIRGVRVDFGDKELIGLLIDKRDKPVIKTIKRKQPQYTKNYKKHLENKKMRQPTKRQLDAVQSLNQKKLDKSRKDNK